jgi:hypothetical protein
MKPLDGFKPVAAMHGNRQGGGDAAYLSPNGMVLGNTPPFVDSHGARHSVQQAIGQWRNDQVLNGTGFGKGSATNPMPVCLQRHHIVGSLIRYQPGSRIGTFHLIENCANLGLPAVSPLVAWWCVRGARTTT